MDIMIYFFECCRPPETEAASMENKREIHCKLCTLKKDIPTPPKSNFREKKAVEMSSEVRTHTHTHTP